MPTNTYVALSTYTVPSAVSSYTFTSIPQGYTDLVVVCNFITSAAQSVEARVGNGSIDTGNNYSNTTLIGRSNNTATSTRRSNFSYFTFFEQSGASSGTWIMNFQDYSNTTTFKTMLGRNGQASSDVEASVQLWRSTSAINTLQLFAGQGGITFSAGSTFSLYGIAAEGTSPAPKATGGSIYSDSTYYYHVFPSTGVFTPTTSLTADILAVAGGGGGGDPRGGGGGAGGVLLLSSQSLSAANYTCTVGAGGSASFSNRGASGTNSTFQGLTAAVGGGGGGGDSNASGLSGGSGGGEYSSGTPGTGTVGQGNDGGSTTQAYSGSGGGGASAVGGTSTSSAGGNGGIGTVGYSVWSSATGIGELVSGTYYLGGGGGGGFGPPSGSGTAGVGGFGGGGTGQVYNGTVATAGKPNTGGGGGGGGGVSGTSYGTPAAGGSGIIVVRYLKA